MIFLEPDEPRCVSSTHSTHIAMNMQAYISAAPYVLHTYTRHIRAKIKYSQVMQRVAVSLVLEGTQRSYSKRWLFVVPAISTPLWAFVSTCTLERLSTGLAYRLVLLMVLDIAPFSFPRLFNNLCCEQENGSLAGGWGVVENQPRHSIEETSRANCSGGSLLKPVS